MSIMWRQALRAFLPLAKNPFVPLQRCSLHSVPPLPHKDSIPGLFTPEAFKMAWTDYQSDLVEKLNYLTADKEYQDNSAVEIAILTARQADLAATFNYASQAHNNHFFFESLTSSIIEIPDIVLGYIPDTFSTKEAMKTEFIATAEAMFGCGWVWLVLDQTKRFRILCTYNAGTPYGEAYRRQDTDANTGETLGNYMQVTRSAVRGSGTQYILPLLNVNCWEHAWITDFGISGKRKYLESWWNSVNWDVVASRLGPGLLRKPYSS